MALPLAWLLVSRGLGASFSGSAPGRLALAPALLIFPVLVLFHGFSPYLGLRTVPAFSMYSNLRTEGGLTNHWFMPSRALRVAGFQEDLVTRARRAGRRAAPLCAQAAAHVLRLQDCASSAWRRLASGTSR